MPAAHCFSWINAHGRGRTPRGYGRRRCQPPCPALVPPSKTLPLLQTPSLATSPPYPSQELLDTPNPNSPAQSDAYVAFTQRRSEYTKRVREQAGRYPPPC